MGGVLASSLSKKKKQPHKLPAHLPPSAWTPSAVLSVRHAHSDRDRWRLAVFPACSPSPSIRGRGHDFLLSCGQFIFRGLSLQWPAAPGAAGGWQGLQVGVRGGGWGSGAAGMVGERRGRLVSGRDGGLAAGMAGGQAWHWEPTCSVMARSLRELCPRHSL